MLCICTEKFHFFFCGGSSLGAGKREHWWEPGEVLISHVLPAEIHTSHTHSNADRAESSIPTETEGHLPPGRFLASSADPAIPNAAFLRAEEFPWGWKPSLAQDRDTTEHQAGIPQPQILPWSLQAHKNPNYCWLFFLFLLSLTLLWVLLYGISLLWNCFASPAKPQACPIFQIQFLTKIKLWDFASLLHSSLKLDTPGALRLQIFLYLNPPVHCKDLFLFSNMNFQTFHTIFSN